MKIGSLRINPYGDEVRFILTKKFSEAERYLFKRQPKEYKKNSDVLKNTYENGGACFYTFDDLHFIFIMEKPKDAYELGMSIHETLHVTINILTRRGLNVSHETSEAYTYLQQFICKELFNFLGVKLVKG